MMARSSCCHWFHTIRNKPEHIRLHPHMRHTCSQLAAAHATPADAGWRTSTHAKVDIRTRPRAPHAHATFAANAAVATVALTASGAAAAHDARPPSGGISDGRGDRPSAMASVSATTVASASTISAVVVSGCVLYYVGNVVNVVDAANTFDALMIRCPMDDVDASN